MIANYIKVWKGKINNCKVQEKAEERIENDYIGNTGQYDMFDETCQ